MTALSKYLLLCLVLISLNFAGQSQTTDTICFPVEVAKKVLIAAEQKKELDKQVSLLNERISNLQQLITTLEDKNSLIAQGYQLQIKTLLEEKATYEDQIKTYEKLLRKERRKRKAVAGAGITVAGILTYLLISK